MGLASGAIQEDADYEWRVRAFDGATVSPWTYGTFRFDSENDPPGACAISHPTHQATVAGSRPELAVVGGLDPEGEVLEKRFVVYRDAQLTEVVADSGWIEAEDGAVRRWVPHVRLLDGNAYFWQGSIAEAHGTAVDCGVGEFSVNLDAKEPNGYSGEDASVAGGLELGLDGIQYSGDGTLEAEFELATDPEFTAVIERSNGVSVSEGAARWTATSVQEDRRYFWRGRVGDGLVEGPWIYGVAIFNGADQVPPAPFVRNFEGPTWVSTLTPTLEVAPRKDAEDDLGHYVFEIFDSPDAETPVESGTSAVEEFVAPALTDRRYYYWRARSVDKAGQESSPGGLSIFFTIDDQVDTAPQFEFLGLDEPSVHRREDIDIRWRDDDPDSNARIALYWDRNSSGADGTLIADGIIEDDPADSYRWDASGVDASVIYLYAVAADAASESTTYAKAPIWLESAELQVTLLDGSTAETGDIGRIGLSLGARPKDYVLIRAEVSDASEAELSPRELVFTPDDWDRARQLTVTGLDDDIADGDIEFTVTLAAESSDPGYHREEAAVVMRNLDDDSAGFFIEAGEPLVVSELGDSAVAGVSLRTIPEAPVELAASLSDTSEASLSPARLMFTPENWDRRQTFVVTGLDDAMIDGDSVFELRFAPAESEDAAYAGVQPQALSVVNLDDDTPFVVVDPTDGLVTTEQGGTAAFEVWLSAKPGAEVVIDMGSADASEGVASPDRLIFDATNWQQPQTVEVTGTPDDVKDGDQEYTVVLSPAVSDDNYYDGLDPDDVRLINREDNSWHIEARSVPLSGSGAGFIRVPFDQSFGFAPVVIARLEGAGDGRYVRIRNVGNEGFEALVLDPAGVGNDLDGLTLRYLAVTPGLHKLPSGHVLEAGSVSTDAAVGSATRDWHPVSLSGETSSPLAFAGIQSFNTPLAVPADASVTWFGAAVGELAPDHLDLALEAAHLNPGTVAFGAEEIGYVVMEDGAEGWIQWSGGNVRFLADRAPSGAEQDCTLQPLVEGGLEDSVMLGQAIERGTTGGLLTECDRGDGYVGYRYLTGGAEAEVPIARLVFESRFGAHLEAQPAGLDLDKAFSLRVFEGGSPGLLGISLSRAPSASVTVSLHSENLSLEPASVTFGDGDWQETRWVQYKAVDDGQPDTPMLDAITLAVESGDTAYSGLEAFSVPVLVAGPRGWHFDIDNEGSQFSTTGTWPVSAAFEGYFGENYQHHAPNGSSPEFTRVDNSDAGFTTIGDWPLETAVPGYVGPDYAFHEPDGLKPGSVVLDDDRATFTHRWPERTNRDGYVGDHFHFHAPSRKYADATWDLSDIEPDRYEVYANWTAFRNHASDAPYEIVDSNGEEHVVRVDQRVNGGSWQLFGTFELDADATVRLTNEADGHVIADAILLVPAHAPPNTAIWETAVPEPGEHHVFARWTAGEDRATNAGYVIHHRDGEAEVAVNQRENGGRWYLLGTFPFEDDVRVELTDVADGRVIADAIKLEHVDAPPNEATWQTSVFAVGAFEAYARWADHRNRATDAPYQLFDGFDVIETRLDQTNEAGSWAYLGTAYMVPDLEGSIVLNDRADGNVVADAVRLVDKRAAGARGIRVFDDPSGAPSGDWRRDSAVTGFLGEGYRVHAAGSGEAAFEWSLSPYRQGAHRVYVRWTSSDSRASDAPYTVTHADGSDVIRMDQRTDGGSWQLLGEFGLDDGSSVSLGNDADGEVVADAVRIVPARYPEAP